MLIDTPITVLLGHSGVGKTNVALHLALQAARAGHPVTLADLDTVNVYFRASDYRARLEAAGVRVEAPVLAGTTLDTPSLSGRLGALVDEVAATPGARLVVDVGGDDDGATVVGRFSAPLERAREQGRAQVLYVVSALRALTQTPEEAAGMLGGIEETARLAATGVLNATNLSTETTLAHVAQGRAFARSCAALLGLPLVATVVPEAALAGLPAGTGAEAALGLGGEPHEELLVAPKYVGVPW